MSWLGVPCFGTPKHVFEYENMAPTPKIHDINCETDHLASFFHRRGPQGQVQVFLALDAPVAKDVFTGKEDC